MPNRKRLSDAEREQRRAEDRRRVQEAAQQLLSSEGWRRWVRVRARNGLSRYSLSNQLLIALACPQATFVAGFRAWLELGYCVRKGERAIRIMAPMPVKDREPDGPDQHVVEREQHARVFFRAVSVFDASQVTPSGSGEPTRLAAPSEPLTGESHVGLLVPLEAFAASIGFEVCFEALGGRAGGWCDNRARRVVVDAGLAGNARVRVLVPWRKGRIPTFGMHVERPSSGRGVRAGRRGSVRTVSGGSCWGWRRGWRSAPSRRRRRGASGWRCRRGRRAARRGWGRGRWRRARAAPLDGQCRGGCRVGAGGGGCAGPDVGAWLGAGHQP